MPRFAILDECEFFDKHTGQMVKMTPERLEKIADRINQRLKRTHDAVPIIPGHTTNGLPEEKQPRIIGKAVHAEVEDFRNPVTQVPVTDESGRVKKAIYVTPIAEPGEFQTFRQLRRGRSVELWLDPDGDDIDPIALLGANTPRRDLGPHQFRLSNGPRGLHRFSRHANSQSVHFEFEIEDEGDDMPDMPPEGGEGGNNAMAEQEATAFENSAMGKRLSAMMDKMEAYMPMLEQLSEMYDQAPGGEGEPGAGGDMPPGGPGAGAPGAGAPMQGQPPVTPGGVNNAVVPAGNPDDEDLFAPAAGHQGTPTAMGSAGCASPAGPMNNQIPGADSHKKKMPSGTTHMSRDTETQVLFARMERREAELLSRIAELEKTNLAGAVERELRAIEPEFDFDFPEQFQRLMGIPKAEDRAREIAYIVKHFRRKADTAPGGGSFTVDPRAVQMSRATGVMTPAQQQTEFGRMVAAGQQQGAPQPKLSNLSDSDLARAAAQLHSAPKGTPFKFQAGADGFGDVSSILAQWAESKRQAEMAAQQPNGAQTPVR